MILHAESVCTSQKKTCSSLSQFTLTTLMPMRQQISHPKRLNRKSTCFHPHLQLSDEEKQRHTNGAFFEEHSQMDAMNDVAAEGFFG
jgi:hypothetical protein